MYGTCVVVQSKSSSVSGGAIITFGIIYVQLITPLEGGVGATLYSDGFVRSGSWFGET